MKMEFNALLANVMGVLRLVAGVLLLLALAIAAVRIYTPLLPAVRLDPQALAYLAGAFWLTK